MVNKSPKYNITRIITLTIVGILICLVATGAILLFWPQNDLDDRIKVNIPKGSTLVQISDILTEKNILTNKNMFITATRLMGKSNKIPAGIFALKDAKNNYRIVRQLVRGNPEMIKVTLLEGWTISQVIQAISSSMNLSSEILSSLCYDEQFINELGLKTKSLEGYLYPDTYLFLESENDPKEILKQIVSEFHEVFNDNLIERAKQIGLTVNEVVTMASIIEGEAIYDNERAIIAAVYNNRLKKRMLLQADPTIQYIIKDGPRRLRLSDLKIDSPYNTYLYRGLPPGPISNPGKASILAVLYPDDNNYLFFVARGDGYHTFTTTIEEHNQAKREFQKVRRLAAKG
ncbi:MAG: endolytic transglycosylase MltG [Planctomycetia bacterium]|nr:endolytic transglycosylase MltG [Planctomycetia bacterium]